MITALWLPPDVIAKSIPLIWPHLERFCKRFPAEYSLREVQLGLLSGQKVGFMAWDEERQISHAFAYGEIINEYNQGRALRMEMIEGDHLGDWRELMDAEFTRFAQEHKCQKVRFIGRKGWAKRLPNYRIVYYVFERGVGSAQERSV